MAVTATEVINVSGEIDEAIESATNWLDNEQTPDGFWVGMLESSYCIEAEWLLVMHFLGYDHPRKRDIVATLINAQRSDGAWEAYFDAPQGDI